MAQQSSEKKGSLQPFHLALPVDDLSAAMRFYNGTLGCTLGRSSEQWIDFNFFGHQLVTHLVPEDLTADERNEVDGDAVPVRHFGIVLEWDGWENLIERLRKKECPFLLEPKIRFQGQAGEQGTFFIRDPARNALEFKTFRNLDQLFAK